MEFDELIITTGVDALVRLVKEKQRVELEDAATVLSISSETLETWARVLEEEGILSIEYRLTKIYLVWVKPTEEQVAIETESFYEEKKDVNAEVEKIKQRTINSTTEMEELQKSFSDFYSKAYIRIDELEKLIAPLPIGPGGAGAFQKHQKELVGIEKELHEIKTGIVDAESEIKNLKIEKGSSESKAWIEKLDGTVGELRTMQNEFADIRKKVSTQKMPEDARLPDISDIRKKFETVKSEFVSLRANNAKIREDMINLHESSEILKSVAEMIMEHEGKIEGMSKELGTLSTQADKLLEKSQIIAEKIKEHAELAGRLNDSVTVAKGIITRFPNQKKVMDELNSIDKKEQELLEKNGSLEKIIEAVGGRQVTTKQFEEISRRMDAKAERMRRDIDALETILEDEKSTYMTFQKIKERIVPSIDSYKKKMTDMEELIEKVKKESLEERKNLEKDAISIQKTLKEGKMKELMKVAEEIGNKKKILDQIKDSFDELVAISDNLTKRITLLSREAKLLEIRRGSGGMAPEEEQKKNQDLQHRVELSNEEELEFKKKREELKRLIRTLWENE
ncbi:hypothetical protein KKF81_00445 [Candidatus Micrarchaeota archaeon]|nr:hypothetical protein [Candidatus Micrarchaeota archaeon]MBU1165387.1 hypothetical protein [Candidatus Micrarchaeota archaeon]MBU1886214.1 hypothetical protein [Candidatus Micrarchaeota archaeon]